MVRLTLWSTSLFPVAEPANITAYHSTYLYLPQFLSLVSEFSEYVSFTPLVRFIPRYFILFKGIVNWIIFLISLSDSSLLAYKNATDFWICILYPAISLNLFISSYSFLVESSGFCMYSIMSSENNDSFTSSFQIWMLFISFISFLPSFLPLSLSLSLSPLSFFFFFLSDCYG